MQPDKLDIKIREAAEHYEPLFDEHAWAKMEKLLDIHLPQKENNKRKFVWLFFLLFIVTVVLLMMVKPWNIEGKALKYPEENIASSLMNLYNLAPADSTRILAKKELPENNSKIKGRNKFQDPVASLITFNKKSFLENSFKQNKKEQQQNNSSSLNTLLKISQRGDDNIGQNKNTNNNNNDIRLQSSNNSQGITKAIRKDEKEENKINIPKENEVINSSAKQTNSSDKAKLAHTKNKNGFSNSFVLNFSVGPDVSAINIGNIGEINPVYGAGIGYNIGKNWAIRTGFYVTRKVYEATSSQYHPPSGFWNSYPDLDYIDANCKVDEVPVIVNYNFSQSSTHLWFGALGLSSYFMKKEVYNYISKNPSAPYPYSNYTIVNKNNHFLASLRVSGGYERKINNTVSIIAEPYLNLPLKGIGYGKVKLYSTGVLFTVSLKPFAKK